MKTAKEWAESVVNAVDSKITIEDDCGWVEIDDQFLNNASLRETATGIIERLVESVQADARAPLEEEVARLCEENGKMRAAVIAARDVCLAHDWDMMSSDGDYERTLVDAIKATGLEYS